MMVRIMEVYSSVLVMVVHGPWSCINWLVMLVMNGLGVWWYIEARHTLCIGGGGLMLLACRYYGASGWQGAVMMGVLVGCLKW